MPIPMMLSGGLGTGHAIAWLCVRLVTDLIWL